MNKFRLQRFGTFLKYQFLSAYKRNKNLKDMLISASQKQSITFLSLCNPLYLLNIDNIMQIQVQYQSIQLCFFMKFKDFSCKPTGITVSAISFTRIFLKYPYINDGHLRVAQHKIWQIPLAKYSHVIFLCIYTQHFFSVV